MNVRHPQAAAPGSLRAGRIAALREAMRAAGLDAWIVPSADPHLSEYLSAAWQGRAWLSGFDGSAGTLVVTAGEAYLWADSRYWTQAEAQLAGSGVALMKMQAGQALPHADWLAANLGAGATVGAHGAVLAAGVRHALADTLARSGVGLRTDGDLLESVWTDRPALPAAPIYEHDAALAGETRTARLAAVRERMRALGADWHFVSTLDDIAWLFNLRGADVNYNPVFLAHALLGPERATLFVGAGKIAADLQAALATQGVDLAPYDDASRALARLPGDAALLVDPRRTTAGLLEAVSGGVRIIEAINPSTLAKSRKTATQAAHVRHAMELDGAALCEVFAWFEAAQGRVTITELTIDEKLLDARARRAGFVSPSFGTIAGFNANGAMPHYRATPEAHATIAGDGLLLVDSGGQYVCGTTDITRVVPVGTPSEAQRRDFTLVLKGVIALSSARFPLGIRSPMLDAIARAPIWAAGIDYGHGTGHGVGYFLNVHEGPQVISHYANAEPQTAMQPGMITSIEPGIYRPGQWGVRIENLVLNQSAPGTEFGEFLSFETLTLCPIDTRCIVRELLRDDEAAWVDAYHATVRERLAPHVDGAARAWLHTRTMSL
jgi:Xaa-Pro aminopeptidase